MNPKFLRYPGGKGKLISFLTAVIPRNYEIDGRYVEPFVGGGALFLNVQPRAAILSDINTELTDVYKGIRAYPHKVWEVYASFPAGREAYYHIRDTEYLTKPIYYKAARTLYLNRTCFKGMWRHGPNGAFSVGYGGEQRRWVIAHSDLVELSKRLKTATIQNCDFEDVLDQCADGDFIFLDPPYKPGEKELLEAHYAYERFTFQDQVRLSIKLRQLSAKRRVRWVMTNSSNEEIRDLYAGFTIARLPKGVSNMVGVHTDGSKEIVITNSGE